MTTRIYIIQAEIRENELQIKRRDIRIAMWFMAAVIVIFFITGYMTMHIETITNAKGF